MKCKEINEILQVLYCNISSALYGYARIGIGLFFSYLVPECYVQRNDVLCRLKCITGGCVTQPMSRYQNCLLTKSSMHKHARFKTNTPYIRQV